MNDFCSQLVCAPEMYIREECDRVGISYTYQNYGMEYDEEDIITDEECPF